MKRDYINKLKLVSALALMGPAIAFAFDSGSTGVDGAFNPTVNTQLQLPPSGVFNFSSVNIPVGVTVTFKKNATNTPVVVLSSTNITVAGAINLSGAASVPAGAAGNGNLGDDGLPGEGGPGGFSGGVGGKSGYKAGGFGLGPGGGGGSVSPYSSSYPVGAGGGGFSSAGANSWCYTNCSNSLGGGGGSVYGSSLLLPLIGGSGGGGAIGGSNYGGSGGGGGGGALLLAASGTLTITGSVVANGGASGATDSGEYAIAGGAGGGGSGGAIRMVATTITGNGTITAVGGAAGAVAHTYNTGGAGAPGRIRLEADSITRTTATNPVNTFSAPGPVFVAGLPTLVIDSVAGVASPASPTGNADITLPTTTPNPVTVVFSTKNVPIGNTVKLTVVPASGNAITAISPALSGTTQTATASVSVTLPTGPSTLQAQTTYTIVASLGDIMRNFAGNERVESVELVAGTDGKSKTNLITVSGKRYEASSEALAVLSATPAFNTQGS